MAGDPTYRAVIAAVDAERSAGLVESIEAHSAIRRVEWQADPDGRGRLDVER